MLRYLLDTIEPSRLITDGAIFKKIAGITGQPFEWLTNDLALDLDVKLYLEHSGSKKLSPYYLRLLALKEQDESIDVLSYIAKNVIMTYVDKWNKLYNAVIDSDYAPLDNYNMEQVETPDITREKDVEVNTKMKTTTSGDSTSSVHGFNSVVAVPSTENEAGSEVEVEGTSDDNNSHEVESETGTRTLTRRGNIGVTTSQQMLESEIKLRSDYNFIKALLDDVSEIICLSVY